MLESNDMQIHVTWVFGGLGVMELALPTGVTSTSTSSQRSICISLENITARLKINPAPQQTNVVGRQHRYPKFRFYLQGVW